MYTQHVCVLTDNTEPAKYVGFALALLVKLEEGIHFLMKSNWWRQYVAVASGGGCLTTWMSNREIHFVDKSSSWTHTEKITYSFAQVTKNTKCGGSLARYGINLLIYVILPSFFSFSPLNPGLPHVCVDMRNNSELTFLLHWLSSQNLKAQYFYCYCLGI